MFRKTFVSQSISRLDPCPYLYNSHAHIQTNSDGVNPTSKYHCCHVWRHTRLLDTPLMLGCSPEELGACPSARQTFPEQVRGLRNRR